MKVEETPPDLNHPRLFEELEYFEPPEPLQVDAEEAALQELVGLDDTIDAAHYHEAKARLVRIEALVLLRRIQIRAQLISVPPSGDQKLNALELARGDARNAAAYALASCRALGRDPDPPTALRLLSEIRDNLREIADR